jgi:hypothetical protein
MPKSDPSLTEQTCAMPDSKTMTPWRPCGPAELELVRESGWTAWPPRLPDQPIFYPVLNEDYATKIARDWNAPGAPCRNSVEGTGSRSA